jgi:hypothetical protein
MMAEELAFLLVMMGLIAFWIKQFNDLMSIPDERFPGRHDKVIWAVVLIVMNVVGALTFWFFKNGKSKG